MKRRMARVCCFVVVAVGLVGVLADKALAQSGQAYIGTWKLNVEKSTSAALSGTFEFQVVGAGVKVVVNTVDAEGVAYPWSASGIYDGKDNHITGKSRNADSVAFTRIDANTIRIVEKLAGVVTITAVYVVSADGNTMNVTRTGANREGQTRNNVMVYTRQ